MCCFGVSILLPDQITGGEMRLPAKALVTGLRAAAARRGHHRGVADVAVANVAFAKVIRATIVAPDERAAAAHRAAAHDGGSENAAVVAAALPGELERARVLPGAALQDAADCTKVLDELDGGGRPTLVMVPKAHLATLLGGTPALFRFRQAKYWHNVRVMVG